MSSQDGSCADVSDIPKSTGITIFCDICDIRDICDALARFCDRKRGQLHQIDGNIAGLSESQE